MCRVVCVQPRCFDLHVLLDHVLMCTLPPPMHTHPYQRDMRMDEQGCDNTGRGRGRGRGGGRRRQQQANDNDDARHCCGLHGIIVCLSGFQLPLADRHATRVYMRMIVWYISCMCCFAQFVSLCLSLCHTHTPALPSPSLVLMVTLSAMWDPPDATHAWRDITPGTHHAHTHTRMLRWLLLCVSHMNLCSTRVRGCPYPCACACPCSSRSLHLAA